MSNHKFEIVIHVAALLAITVLIITFLNLDYPFVGHDYSYLVPRLLDTDIHYKINGLSIQWYTPSFGGGGASLSKSEFCPVFVASASNPLV